MVRSVLAPGGDPRNEVTRTGCLVPIIRDAYHGFASAALCLVNVSRADSELRDAYFAAFESLKDSFVMIGQLEDIVAMINLPELPHVRT